MIIVMYEIFREKKGRVNIFTFNIYLRNKTFTLTPLLIFLVPLGFIVCLIFRPVLYTSLGNFVLLFLWNF